ncbi:zf-C3HC-domain-containing protein [Trichodelitschia bisporula]|uniref:Zf-C3HC-domain-containing protein n=1 Tax=Trichodelitschia bisporula TaxID=703511 RepID=A0A6G1HS62_9PEZI|nr:zf-C3HC-domain-containing protein [Trichodelitschia bisporula]
MSVPLNVTKRKFYKLLDNLSSSKLPTEDSLKEPPSKRSRVSGASSRQFDRPSSSASDRPVSMPAGDRWTVLPVGDSPLRSRSFSASKDPGRPLPNFAPWSQDQFLARLKTFSDVRTWTPKPADIGEVEWAKRGWVVDSKDKVACKGGCEKRVALQLTPPTDSDGEAIEESWWVGDVEDEVIAHYKALIVDGHEEDCLWRKSGCKEDIYRIRMSESVIWQHELKSRISSLLTIKDELPVHLVMPSSDRVNFDIDDFAATLPPDITQPEEKSPLLEATSNTVPTPSTSNASLTQPVNKTALTMAMCGWSGLQVSGVKMVHCTRCFQRAGLWLYRKPVAQDTGSEPEDAMKFDPVELHREHCPWKNVVNQNSTGILEGLSGWEVQAELVIRSRHRTDIIRKARAQEAVDSPPPPKSREEIQKEDKVRESKLAKLRRAFTVKKKPDKEKPDNTDK